MCRVHGPPRLTHVVYEASSFPLPGLQVPFMCVYVCALAVIILGVYVCVCSFVRSVIRLKM